MEPLFVPPGYLTAHQVAAQLGIGLPAVRQLVRRGHLHHAGGSPRQPYYAWPDVQQLIRARARVPEAA
ncbi:helix-turn-helix domain-containing protein [Streptomyces sp. NBRC 109706]|uniref:helix-turn-helix domain-containing protein n=1 Tax=Streptomyces sp. NBRC 109706 TaxID=1550035 RepID=UPI0007851FC7|nr:helix-turn-helix domain-containing protein [Streptomyces sp. NBRC 109706]